MTSKHPESSSSEGRESFPDVFHIGQTVPDVVFTVKYGKGGKKQYEARNVLKDGTHHKLFVLKEGLEALGEVVAEEGKSCVVRILEDTRPDRRDKGMFVVEIIPDNAETHARKEKKRREMPSPIERDEDRGVCYVLDVALPLREPGPLTPRPEDFAYFTLDKRTVETVLKVATGAHLRQPVLLEGETAASKTSSIEFLAMKTGNEIFRMNLNGQTDTSELVGKYVPNDGQLQIAFEELIRNRAHLSPESQQILDAVEAGGRGLTLLEAQKIAGKEGFAISEWRWQDGIIPRAMKEGKWVILDEINLAEPQILERLNSVLEHNPQMTLSENGGVKIGSGGEFALHSDFRIFATMNPAEYTGRQPMSPAYKDRWICYKYVESPSASDYEAMMRLMLIGEQPKITIDGESYQGESTVFLLPKITQLDQNLFQKFREQFLPAFAKFHVDIATAAANRTIGRGRKEKYVFTRRGVIEFLRFLNEISLHNRRNGIAEHVGTHPKKIFARAYEYFYGDKITDPDDRKKVEDILKIHGLGQWFSM